MPGEEPSRAFLFRGPRVGASQVRYRVPFKSEVSELSILQQAVAKITEPAGQGCQVTRTLTEVELMVYMAHYHQVPISVVVPGEPSLRFGFDTLRFVAGSGAALAAEPGTQCIEKLRVERLGENYSGTGAYNGPERVVGPVEGQESVAVADEYATVSELMDGCVAGSVASIALAEVCCSPDIVVAADEMDGRAGFPNPIQGCKDAVVTLEPEVRVVEPEVEYVPQQEKVVCLVGVLQEPDESIHAMTLGVIRAQMEMAVGDKERNRMLLR